MNRIQLAASAALISACVQQLPTLQEQDGSVPDSGLLDAERDTIIDQSNADVPDAGFIPPDGPSLAAGNTHTCAVEQGALICWGDNENGQLGRPGPGSTRAALTDATSEWVSVSARGRTTCGRTSDRRAWCWGNNEDGQLGVRDFFNRDAPTVIPLDDVLSIRPGYHSTCAIDAERSAFCWGQDREGQVAIGSPPEAVDQPLPVPIALAERWQQLTVGQGHACGLAGGNTWCWGRNTSRQLGLGSDAPPQTRVPTVVDSVPFVQIAAGQNHTCALTEAGALYCWGGNTFGQLGTGDHRNAASPRLIDSGPFQQVDVDTFHSCAIRLGELLCWGSEFIGAPQDNLQLAPVQLDGRTDWIEVRTGRFHTCARRRDGSVWCRGENKEGQVGAGERDQEHQLLEVVMPGPI